MKSICIKKRSFIAIILVIAVLMTACGAKADKTGTIEGKGYDTPEEALKAFAEAYSEKDMDKMYKTCAVESFVENFNLENDIEASAQSWNPHIIFMSGDSEKAKEFNIASRKSDLFEHFYYMYQYPVSEKISEDFLSFPHSLQDTKMQDILEAVKGVDGINSIKVGDIVEPEEVSKTLAEKYSSENIKKLLSKQQDIYGGEVAGRIIKLEIDGVEYYLFAQLIKHDEKWYVNYMPGIIGGMLDILTNHGGLCRVSAIPPEKEE